MIISAEKEEKALRISQLNFDLSYFIQLKRVACNLSQAELSFLIGRGTEFIKERESFKQRKEWCMGDLDILSKLFDCSTAEFFRNINEVQFELDLLGRQQREFGRIQYEAFKLKEGGEKELLYRINEIDPATRFNQKQKNDFLMRARKEIFRLIEDGYFDQSARNPYDIFKECRRWGGKLIKAEFIAQVLNEDLINAVPPLLKRFKDKRNGFVYASVYMI